MMTSYRHYVPGGGLGDQILELYGHQVLAKLSTLQKEYGPIAVTVMSHNPSVVDLYTGTVDSVAYLPFPMQREWDPRVLYEEFPQAFANATELRWESTNPRSAYHYARVYGGPSAAGQLLWVDEPVADPEWKPNLTPEEWAVVDSLRGKVVIHAYAGERWRNFPAEITDYLARVLPDALWVGARYDRENHSVETGTMLAPRVLLEVLRRARGVVATCSSVYLAAAVLETPYAVLCARGSDMESYVWPFWKDRRSEVFELPLGARGRDFVAWVEQLIDKR